MSSDIRNRIVDRKRMQASEILPNLRNWRDHPEEQRRAALAVLKELGQAGELLAYYSARNGGKLTLIDGHLRHSFGGEWDVAITDFTDEEADKLLLVYDPLAAMAEANAEKLKLALKDVEMGDADLAGLLEDLEKESGVGTKQKKKERDVEFKQEFSILIRCDNEDDQKEILGELDRHGLNIKAMVVDLPVADSTPAEIPPIQDGEIEIVRESAVTRSPRVIQLEGMFDVPPSQRAEERWRVRAKLDRPWQNG